MYFLAEIKSMLPVEPKHLRLDRDPKELVLSLARKALEGQTLENIGQIIAIMDVELMGEGEIKLRDPHVYFKIKIKALLYKPVKNEILVGKVENITEASLYINIGGFDAILPMNQIGPQQFRYIAKRKEARSKKGRIVIRRGDWIRARIVRFHYRVPAEIGPLFKGGLMVSLPRKVSPKTEISVVLRSKDRGLGPEKVLEKVRKEVISSE